MSRVLVVGGTGRTGRLVVTEATAMGHHVTVAARNPDAARSLFTPAVQVVHADAHDPASIERALHDQDVVVLSVSSSARKPGNVYSDAARAIVDGARGTTVSRAVVVSSGGVRPDDTGLPAWYRRVLIPLFMSDLYDDMRAMERVFRESELAWTFVRAAYLGDRPRAASIRVEDDTNPKGGWRLGRADLAAFVAAQIDGTEWIRRSPTLAE